MTYSYWLTGKGMLNSRENISVEVKTGLNISLGQTEKYIWNGTTVVLVSSPLDNATDSKTYIL